jgi:hypothetical protein
MAITPETRQRLFQRAGGRCECEMECEEHKGTQGETMQSAARGYQLGGTPQDLGFCWGLG